MDGWDGLDWISEGRWLKELSVGIENGFQESRGWQGKGEPDKVGWVVVEIGSPLVPSLNILVYVTIHVNNFWSGVENLSDVTLTCNTRLSHILRLICELVLHYVKLGSLTT